MTNELLTKGMPKQFTDYLDYCDNIRFDDRPNYTMLAQQFELLLKELVFATGDEEFCWVTMKKQLVEKRRIA